MSGKLDRLLLDGNFESACAHAREMESIFGKGHYLRGNAWITAFRRRETACVPLLVQVSRANGHSAAGRPMTATTSAAKTRTRRKMLHVHPDRQDAHRRYQPHAHEH
ncbi:MAG: hypothetical protein ACLR4A_13035 [Christensenellales bacterium]